MLQKLRKLIYFILDTRCVLCGTPWFKPGLCPGCVLPTYQGSSHLDWVTSSVELNTSSRKLLHYIKYQNRFELCSLLIDYLPQELPYPSADLVLVPVPLSLERFYQRGFNQSEWLAHRLARKLKLRVEVRGLIKVKETLAQSTLDRNQRATNLTSAFQWRKSIQLPKAVCLVDDVITTGETLKACKAALNLVGIREVFGWTLFAKSGVT